MTAPALTRETLFQSRGISIVVPPTGAYIDGAFRAALDGATRPIREAATGLTMADAAECSPGDVDLAAEAATRAARGWAMVSFAERTAIFHRVAKLIGEHLPELAHLETANTGKPIRDTLGGEIQGAAELFRHYADPSHALMSDVIGSEDQSLVYTRREPYGVVGVIVPWNYPFWNAVMQVAPAMSVGNTVVLKPSELTPLSSFALAAICQEAGVPPGVLNVVPGAGTLVGQAIVKHPMIHAISFTGSTRVGRDVLVAAANASTPVNLELGGKSPNVIFDDADLDAASSASFYSFASNQGQLCVAGTRVIVQQSVQHRIVESLHEQALSVVVGDPFDPETELGCVISAQHADMIAERLASARLSGAHVTGGDLRNVPGCNAGRFFVPAVVQGASSTSPIAQDEVFGPVAVILSFADEDEAVDLANGTRFGLSAALWTRDVARAHRVASRIAAGLVWINTTNTGSLATPSSPWRASGSGVAGGVDHARWFTRRKTVHLNLDGPTPSIR